MPPTNPANLLAFWRAAELFAPQPLPKLAARDSRATTLAPNTPLPWQPHHPLHREHHLDPKQCWRHTIYLGVYSLDRAFADIRRSFPSRDDPRELPQAGRSALAALLVADDGRPLLTSIQLASCSWAIALALRDGLDAVATGTFDQAARAFRDELNEILAPDEDDEIANALAAKHQPVGPPLEAEHLHACLQAATDLLQLEHLDDAHHLKTATTITIVSTRISARDRHDAKQREFLNSFFATDLHTVAHAVRYDDIGPALRAYLSPQTPHRTDVEQDLKTVRRALTPHAIPAGRWPSDPANNAALGQQLALNTALNDPKTLHAVNGPPGTGKTTLLRDLFASVVVTRAEHLAQTRHARGRLRRPDPLRRPPHPSPQARPHRARAGSRLPDQRSGRERHRRDPRRRRDRSPIRHRPLHQHRHVPVEPPACEPTRHAWGLIAGVLGNRANNSTFASRFWWEGMKVALKDEPAPSWQQAVADFTTAQEKLETVRHHLAAYSDPLDEREDLQHHRDTLPVPDLTDLQAAERELDEHHQTTEQARATRDRQRHALATHQRARPPFWRRLFSSSWHEDHERLTRALTTAEHRVTTAATQQRAATQRAEHLAEQAAAHQRERQRTEQLLRELDDLIPRLRDDWAENSTAPYPDNHWECPDQRDHRERKAPWSTETLNRARTELFLAALQLHKAFILGAKNKMAANLRAATDLISGRANDTNATAAKAAWQSLFIAVPLLSTTFASVSYLFRNLGREGLGWLLIDEAGQATPQSAVGALWRAKRAIVVGDPLQLEPIVQLPKSIERRLRERHDIDRLHTTPEPSVQRRADRASNLGTLRGDEHERVWVGIPLNAHRRCDAPMFDISNQIAYRSQMINCTPPRPDLALPASHWIDVPPNATTAAHGNWLPAEGEALTDLLDGLRYRLASLNLDFSDVFLITPFRAVVQRIEPLARAYPGLTAGTIHKAQGREADIVILTLGGDPAKPGARAWAAHKPNLLNVAVSRARRRLYVIGDQRAWSQLPHFDTPRRRAPAHPAATGVAETPRSLLAPAFGACAPQSRARPISSSRERICRPSLSKLPGASQD